jgi:heme exporter protein D
MMWHSAAEFFEMGGYGRYVWGAYSLTVLIMAVEVAQVVRRRRRALAQARAMADTEGSQ